MVSGDNHIPRCELNGGAWPAKHAFNLAAGCGDLVVAGEKASWKIIAMGRIFVGFLACCVLASSALGQDLQVKVIGRSTVPDDGYEEEVFQDPALAGPGWRIRTWTPLGEREPDAPPMRAVVVIDGQADVGVAAAMARQAGAVLADDALLVVTVSPADEAVAQTFRRQAWTAEQRKAMARFLGETLAPRLRGRRDVGPIRLIGLGRGADVALMTFSDNPAAFDSVHAKDHQLSPEALTALSAGLPRGNTGLALKLDLVWTQGKDVADPSAMAFLEQVKARGHAVEWKINETDEQFLWRSLFRP